MQSVESARNQARGTTRAFMDSLLIGRGERCLHSDWTEQFNRVS